MNPLGARGRAQEFADLLEAGLARSSGTPLTSYAGIAARLQTVGAQADTAIAPRPEFSQALRTRLMAVAAVQTHAAPAQAAVERKSSAVSWGTRAKSQRGLGVAAGAMASVVAVTGVAVAAGESLPGDPFYGVKKGAEAFQLRTADGDVDKGTKHLAYAERRLDETRGLALGRDAALGPVGPVSAASAFGGSTAERVKEALRDMDAQTRSGSTLLTAAYRETQTDVPLRLLSAFATKQSAQLRDLLPALPAAARERAESSLALVTQVGAESSQLLAVGVCTGLCNPAEAPAVLPSDTAQPQPSPQTSASETPPCGCETTAPTPVAPGTPEPTPQPTAQPTAAPTTTPTAQPTPTAEPTPSASPSPSPTVIVLPSPLPTVTVPPLPVPLPVPLPTPTGLPAPKAAGPIPDAPVLVQVAPALLTAGTADGTGDGAADSSGAPVGDIYRSGGPADPVAL